MSIRDLLARIPSTQQPAEVIEHPANDPRELGKREHTLSNQLLSLDCHIERIKAAADADIEDIKRNRDELLSEAFAERTEIIPKLNDVRKSIGQWASSHGVNGAPKLEAQE